MPVPRYLLAKHVHACKAEEDMYLTWYPAFALLYCPLVFFAGTWIVYIAYTLHSSDATKPPIRMITEMFRDEPLASSLVAGVPATMMSVGLFATGVLLDVVSIGSSTKDSSKVRSDTPIFFAVMGMGTALKLTSFLLVLSVWVVICTAQNSSQEWHMITHVSSALLFMFTSGALLWIVYKFASLLLPPRYRTADRIVAYMGEVCCAAGIVTASSGFDDWKSGGNTGALLIASGELVILGALTLSIIYLLIRIGWELDDVRLEFEPPTTNTKST